MQGQASQNGMWRRRTDSRAALVAEMTGRSLSVDDSCQYGFKHERC